MSLDGNLQHSSRLLLLGSCFSDEIGRLLKDNGFAAAVNPGGTLFHPLAIAKLLKWALAEQFVPLRMYQREDICLSWDLSGTFYALCEEEFENKCQQLHADLRYSLLNYTHLIITFGSSWAYLLQQDNEVVTNCHKAPKSSFSKELSKLDDMLLCWKNLLNEIKQVNPSLQVIFTVSPVKHLKDGLVENNRSKARLHLLAEELCALPACTYFEAYELVSDELRDYTFYKADGAHPNERAITVVWQLFQERFLTVATKECLEEWNTLQKLKTHKILYPESKEAQQHLKKLEQKERSFFFKYPNFQRSTPS
ncbi:MAG: GSCFA domain-containing protein [Flavobacteriales bacterium]